MSTFFDLLLKLFLAAALVLGALSCATLYGQAAGTSPTPAAAQPAPTQPSAAPGIPGSAEAGAPVAPNPAFGTPTTTTGRAPLPSPGPAIPGGTSHTPSPAITPGPSIGASGSVAPSPAISPGPAIPSLGPGVSAPAPRPVIDPRTGLAVPPNATRLGAPGATRRTFSPDNNTVRLRGSVGANGTVGVTGSGALSAGIAPGTDLSRLPLQLGAPLVTTFGQNADLGVVLDARGNRVQIASLNSGAFGASAGFQVGDQILAVNQSWVLSPQTLQEQLAASLQRSGQAWVYVNRNGTPQWVNLDLSGRTRGMLGVNILDAGGNVQIARVFPGSVALKAGLRPGDQILSANGATVSSSAELMNLIRTAAAGNGELNLVVRRDGYEQTLKATVTTNDAIAAAAAAQVGATGPETAVGGLSTEQAAQLRARAASLRAALGKLRASGGEISSENVVEFQTTANELLQILDAMDAQRQ